MAGNQNSVNTAIILWVIGFISCPIIMLLFPKIIGALPLSVLIAPLISVILTIAGGLCYKNKNFSKKGELKKSLVRFRVAYSISWLLFTVSVGAIIIIMSSCDGFGCLSVLVFAPSVLPLIAYSITFMVIASSLKKKLS